MSTIKLNCEVTPTDRLTAYVARDEGIGPVLAIVLEDERGAKVSALLGREQAMQLHTLVDGYLDERS